MTSSPDNPRLETSLHDELVAYLDGELDAEACRRIEGLLARDESVRAELHSLERVWDALDELPRAEVAESFTQSTVEMIAVTAEDDWHREQCDKPRQRRRAAVAIGLGAALMALLGYAGVSRFAPDANEQLARDLPLLERLDEFRQIDDFRLLQLLVDVDAFPPGGESDVE